MIPGISAPESVCVLMLFMVLQPCLSVDLMEAFGQGVGGRGCHREWWHRRPRCGSRKLPISRCFLSGPCSCRSEGLVTWSASLALPALVTLSPSSLLGISPGNSIVVFLYLLAHFHSPLTSPNASRSQAKRKASG